MNKMKGAIFDMDGTLLDSMHVWRTKGEDYLRSRGLEPHAGANEATQYMSMAQMAGYFRAEYGLRDSEQQIIDDLNRMVENQYLHVVLAKEGVPEALERLAGQGVRMCVATATESAAGGGGPEAYRPAALFFGCFHLHRCGGRKRPARHLLPCAGAPGHRYKRNGGF